MGQEIVYCNLCGNRILESEFRKGRALTVLKKNYCPTCAQERVPVSAPSDVGRKEGGKTRNPGSGQPRRTTTTDISAAALRKRSIPLPFIVAIGIGIIVVVLLWVVLSRNR